MAKCRTNSSPDEGLIGIDFPGMKVNHHRLVLHVVDMLNGPVCYAIWNQPQISASGHAHVLVRFLDCRRWKLEYGMTAWPRLPVREPLRVRNSIKVMSHRKDR